ncbi:zinc-ribbon domain-containing protein [Chloroflexota bacterium]
MPVIAVLVNCKKCGSEIRSDWHFCPSCGDKIVCAGEYKELCARRL